MHDTNSPFVLLVAPTVVPNSFSMDLFDAEELKMITQTSKHPEQMLFDIAKNETLQHLKMFRFVVAFDVSRWSLSEVAYGLSFIEHPTPCMPDYTIISFNLCDLFLFITQTNTSELRGQEISFMNWCYPILERYYKDLGTHYKKINIPKTHLFRVEKRTV